MLKLFRRHRNPRAVGIRPPVAFLYNSRECLWPGLKPYLEEADEPFLTSWRRSERFVKERLGWSLIERLARVETVQDIAAQQTLLEPLLTTLQIALTDAWQGRGVGPTHVAGRSAGEFAAGYGQGALSDIQALELACRVSEMFSSGRSAGNVVRLKGDALDEFIRELALPLYFTADGREHGRYFSCAPADLAGLLDAAAAANVEAHVEPMTVAAHSPIMDAYRDDFIKTFGSDVSRTSPVHGFSSVSAGPHPEGPLTPDYWWNAIREPVLMQQTFETMMSSGVSIFLEIGARGSFGPILRDAARVCGRDIHVIPSMMVDSPVRTTMDAAFEELQRVFALSVSP
ncbi:MAG: acyltransferase domain-containing protein [Acidobacteriota bacterium]